MRIIIPVLANSYFELNKFDFSFKDITIYDISSEEFENYIEKQQPDFKAQNLSFFNSIIESIHSEYDKKYVIVKNNPKENFKYSEIYNVWKILLIIFPSDLQIEYEVAFEYEDDFFQRSYMSTNEKRYTGDYPGDLLISDDEDVPEINEFISTYYENINDDNYIGLAIESYLNSYTASHYHFQYLTLCMSLESIIYGDQELTYRLRRSIGLICGEKPYNCHRIYNNINKLYKIRSKIIHGEKFDVNKIIEYLESLRAIVSRVIIELIVHNVTKKEDLNNRITELGFGDREKISDNWKPYKLNISTFVASNWKELK